MGLVTQAFADPRACWSHMQLLPLAQMYTSTCDHQLMYCCTMYCRTAQVSFDAVIVEEASQATEPRCLIPLSRCTGGRAVLVGDHKQLGPCVGLAAGGHAGRVICFGV